MKYYAVKIGHKPGVYTSWSECEAQVKGYANASHKSFSSKEDAEAFCFGDCATKNTSNTNHRYAVYVDGSFNSSTNRYGYGLVFLRDGKVFAEKFSGGNNPEFAALRNVAGEMIAAGIAIQKAIDDNEPEVHIYFDYTGLSNWADGTWKAKNSCTQRYSNFCKAASEKIKIVFHKVAAHSGDYFNSRADELARQGAGV